MKYQKIKEISKRKGKKPIVCLTAYSKTIAEILGGRKLWSGRNKRD